MLRFTRLLDGPAVATTTLTLTLEQREKGRLRVVLDDGVEAGLFLARGGTLREGDLLACDEGVTVRVVAAREPLCCVRSDDPQLLARACYHLGNRHVPLQIEPGRLCFRQDHVLEEMLRGMGMQPVHEQAPFQPEQGAYGGHQHG